jgi:hypothetical protein
MPWCAPPPARHLHERRQLLQQAHAASGHLQPTQTHPGLDGRRRTPATTRSRSGTLAGQVRSGVGLAGWLPRGDGAARGEVKLISGGKESAISTTVPRSQPLDHHVTIYLYKAAPAGSGRDADRPTYSRQPAGSSAVSCPKCSRISRPRARIDFDLGTSAMAAHDRRGCLQSRPDRRIGAFSSVRRETAGSSRICTRRA